MQGRSNRKPQPKPDLHSQVPLEEDEEEEEERNTLASSESGSVVDGKLSAAANGGGSGLLRAGAGAAAHDGIHGSREGAPLMSDPLLQMKLNLLRCDSFKDSFKSVVDKQDDPEDGDELQPPKNFAMVYRGVYRSAYPTKKNFAFLKKLGLRSVIYLCQEEYSNQVIQFYEANNVRVYGHGVSGNKEPFVDISDEMIQSALQRLLDVRYHPVLIHCNQGKHRTGSLVGCLRAMNHWSMTAIFDEYRRFAGSKARRADQQFIELFHRKCPMVPTDSRYHPEWFLG